MIDPCSVYCIVVTYNAENWIEKCLSSVVSSDSRYQIIVIDNNSTDQTKAIIKEKFPHARLIESAENLGFGKANNIGLRLAYSENAEHFFLLNQDAWVGPQTIQSLAEKLRENKEFGVLSPMQFFDQNSLDWKFSSYINTGKLKNWDNLSDKELNAVYPVRFVNAAVWMMSRSCIETVGLFAPVFSHYGEDQNYCHRCKFHEVKVGVYPGARAYHERAQNPRVSGDLRKLLVKDRNYCITVLLNLKHSFLRQWGFLLFKSVKELITSLLQFRFRAALVRVSRMGYVSQIRELAAHRGAMKKRGAYLDKSGHSL